MLTTCKARTTVFRFKADRQTDNRKTHSYHTQRDRETERQRDRRETEGQRDRERDRDRETAGTDSRQRQRTHHMCMATNERCFECVLVFILPSHSSPCVRSAAVQHDATQTANWLCKALI
jgi:hypothetical protein